jgi:hypothetical protein
MRKRLMMLLGVVALLLAVAGVGVGSVFRELQRVEAQAVTQATKTFRGGERACVIVFGDHNPPSPLDIFVYDAQNRLVAKDQAPSDIAAAIWYPAQTASYRIEIHNNGNIYNEITVYMQGIEHQ